MSKRYIPALLGMIFDFRSSPDAMNLQ